MNDTPWTSVSWQNGLKKEFAPMFNLLVAADGNAWETDQLMRMEAGRFKEACGAEAESIEVDDPQSLSKLELVHSLLMYERGAEGPNVTRVRFGRLRNIRRSGTQIEFRFAERGYFSRSIIEEYADRLGIGTVEFIRTHWAIKDGVIPPDLLAMLESASPRDLNRSIDDIIRVLRDRSDEERSEVIHQIHVSTSLDRSALAARLRSEIVERFGPNSEVNFESAIRDPKSIPAIRSWMVSALLWADSNSPESRQVLLDHIRPDVEPDRLVRYWTLSGLYQRRVSYLSEATAIAGSDSSAPEVMALAQAVGSPSAPELIERFRRDLYSDLFQTVWPVLRLLRVVPILGLAGDVCQQLNRSASDTSLAYDSLYALSQPDMARAAALILDRERGVEQVLGHIFSVARNSNRNAIRNFTVLLNAFDSAVVDDALAKAEKDSSTLEIARQVRTYLNDFRRRGEGRNQLSVAGYASDTIDVRYDALGIQEEVHTLAAVMLAKKVEPPLAIGLFGDWGAGKSYFMKSMKRAAEDLSQRATSKADSVFCSNIVQIEFNAWHYVDTNIWASLVDFILKRLDAYVTPRQSPEQQEATLLNELSTAKVTVQVAESEKARSQAQIEESEKQLQVLQLSRENTTIGVLDLRVSDYASLLTENQQVRQELENSLTEIGVPAVINNFSALSQVVSEAHTFQGRAAVLFLSIVNAKKWQNSIGFMIGILVVIPLVALIVRYCFQSNDMIIALAALMAQIGGLVFGLTAILREGIKAAKAGLDKLENAKQKLDQLVADRRQNPTEAEIALQQQIKALKVQEQQASSLLAMAEVKTVELEKKVLALNEERSLARFLSDRSGSDDYRKHLGLVSTIRQDFEDLGKRLSSTQSGADRPAVERIILFIDDLDRCPADKVLDVLQAVHLLLAYPLFVVVVGVDPRWLLHALQERYSAFQNQDGANRRTPAEWKITPQNYLEKIFQIPFALRPMTAIGFGKLIDGLLAPSATTKSQVGSITSALASDSAQTSSNLVVPRESSDSVDNNSTYDSSTVLPSMDVPEPQDFVVYEDSLVIKPWEASFAQTLFALIQTPRAVKRFSNVYRILKAPVKQGNLSQFEGSAEVPGEFQVPMLLLAILIGAPTEGPVLLETLLDHVMRKGDANEALQHFDRIELQSAAFEELENKIGRIIARSGFRHESKVYQYWIPRVSRFSFEMRRGFLAVAPYAASE